MAGIKHNKWFNTSYYVEKNQSQPHELASESEWAQWAAREAQVSCRICGNVILQANQDMHGQRVDWAAEMQAEMHTACYIKAMEEMRNGSSS